MSKENITRVIERIKKMLALAENAASAPNEAATAARMAESLMRKHNIDMAEIITKELASGEGLVREFAIDDFDHASNKYPQWLNFLAVAISKMFDCHVTLGWTGRHTGGKACVNIQFFGYRDDVAISKWMFSYLIHEINRLADRYWEVRKVTAQHDGSTAKLVKKNYREGASTTICARIDEIVSKRAEELKSDSVSTALVVVKRKAVEEEFGEFKYNSTQRKGEYDGQAYNQGRHDGKNINLSRPLEDKTSKNVRIQR